MSDEQPPPTSRDLHDIVHEALSQPTPRPSWWRRLIAAVRGLPSWLTRNGGYWGGVTMWDRLKAAAARATAFLRR